MIQIADMATAIVPTQIREVTKLAKPTSLNLGIGQPDLPMPDSVRDALKTFSEKGYAPYVPNAGTPSCRAKVAEHEGCDAENVMVTCGVQEGLAVAIMGTVNRGDRVLVPNPGFPAYENLVRSVGAVSVEYDMDPDWSWPLDRIEKLIVDQSPKAIILNNPSNPTGIVQSPVVVESLAKLCERHGVLMISDEIYSQFTFGSTPFSSPRTVAPEHTIVLNGMSKSHASMGLRLGWLIAPSNTITALTPLHQHLVTSAPSISQYAAEIALDDQEGRRRIRDEIAHRADVATALASELLDVLPPGTGFMKPDGAFYLMMGIAPPGQIVDDVEVAKRLLHEYDVVTIPGSGFGSAGAGHLRVAYTVSEDILSKAFERIKQFFATV